MPNNALSGATVSRPAGLCVLSMRGPRHPQEPGAAHPLHSSAINGQWGCCEGLLLKSITTYLAFPALKKRLLCCYVMLFCTTGPATRSTRASNHLNWTGGFFVIGIFVVAVKHIKMSARTSLSSSALYGTSRYAVRSSCLTRVDPGEGPPHADRHTACLEEAMSSVLVCCLVSQSIHRNHRSQVCSQ